MSPNKFRLVSSAEVSRIKAGTIMFLPPRSELPKAVVVNLDSNEGAFNHPVIIASCPSPKEMKHKSLVQIAIMTSFNGTTIKKHLAAKGIKKRTGTEAAAFSGHLRVATVSKPFALDTLKLRNGKGMKRDCSYVSIRRTYAIELRALALYGGLKEEVDAYCLTAHATRKLNEAINEYKNRKRGIRIKLTVKKEKPMGKTDMAPSTIPEETKIDEVPDSPRPLDKPTFKRMNWKGSDLKDGIKKRIDLTPLISPRSGLRPRYETQDGIVLTSPRLVSRNPYRTLNPRGYR